MRFKKVYIEITNRCNLCCSFCGNNKRKKEDMSISDFEEILKKIDSYTNYVYLHVKGEPLFHCHLDKILDLCQRYHKKVCITTNGVLLKERLDILKEYEDTIYQINISLHSENNKDYYLEDIIESVLKLQERIYISYRFWTLDKNVMDDRMITYMNHIKKIYDVSELVDGMKLSNNLYLSLDQKFDWPSLDCDYIQDNGYCYGLKDQIGVLVDGTVVICCLDSNGDSKIGNLIKEDMNTILNSDKVNNIILGFRNRKVYLDLCKHCSYKMRFDKKKTVEKDLIES